MKAIQTFTEQEIIFAKFAKALSHPARIAILKVLIAKNACICGDIVMELPLSQSTVSQHLKELKSAGIIKGEIDGVKTCYCIDTEKWKKIAQLFGEFFSELNANDISCC
jgi:ArsR family transcriptional regulator, arsenate/arsenite/antimonite-responsive transcriptional repressor